MGSSRMGLSRTGSVLGSFGCCEWDHHDGEIVANGIAATARSSRMGSSRTGSVLGSFVGIVRCWDRRESVH